MSDSSTTSTTQDDHRVVFGYSGESLYRLTPDAMAIPGEDDVYAQADAACLVRLFGPGQMVANRRFRLVGEVIV